MTHISCKRVCMNAFKRIYAVYFHSCVSLLWLKIKSKNVSNDTCALQKIYRNFQLELRSEKKIQFFIYSTPLSRTIKMNQSIAKKMYINIVMWYLEEIIPLFLPYNRVILLGKWNSIFFLSLKTSKLFKDWR